MNSNGETVEQAARELIGRHGRDALRIVRERAEIAGGKLTVWSEVGAGTEVELRVPANTAYAKTPRRSWFAEKLSRKAEG